MVLKEKQLQVPAGFSSKVIEIDAAPGMSYRNLVLMAVYITGIDFAELVWRILAVGDSDGAMNGADSCIDAVVG